MGKWSVSRVRSVGYSALPISYFSKCWCTSAYFWIPVYSSIICFTQKSQFMFEWIWFHCYWEKWLWLWGTPWSSNWDCFHRISDLAYASKCNTICFAKGNHLSSFCYHWSAIVLFDSSAIWGGCPPHLSNSYTATISLIARQLNTGYCYLYKPVFSLKNVLKNN